MQTKLIDSLQETPASWVSEAMSTWRGRYDLALADFDLAIQLDAKEAAALSGRAFLRATCPDATIREGKKALDDAKKACEIRKWAEPNALQAYAAACAETGDFTEAVKWQKKVLENAGYMKTSYGPDARMRLELYEAKKPFRLGTRKRKD